MTDYVCPKGLKVAVGAYMRRAAGEAPEEWMGRAILAYEATKTAPATELVLGNIRMDNVRREVFVNGEKTRALTPKEYELLRYFMERPGRALTIRQIVGAVWGPGELDGQDGGAPLLRVFVGKLRRIIEVDPQIPTRLLNINGYGYIMEDKDNGANQDAA